MTDILLAINAGSSSFKYAVHDWQSLDLITRESIELDSADRSADRYRELVGKIMNGRPHDRIRAVGHRIVHGGMEYSGPVVIDDTVLERLEGLVPLAPLHQPWNLMPIKILCETHPHLPQAGCFDTAFHRDQPMLNQLYALPRDLTAKGVLRYGFHGLSCEYIASVLPEHSAKAAERVVIAHLGSGASACAMHNLLSVSSTMGFTPLDGLMMGTRCGMLDPGVPLYLLRQEQLSPEDLEDLFYRRSGLLGVSGISADTRDLLDSEEPAARQAIDLFCRYAARGIAQLAADLEGLDVLVFTGGVGEHQGVIRDRIAAALAWIGDFEVLVIATDEEQVIARHTRRILESSGN